MHDDRVVIAEGYFAGVQLPCRIDRRQRFLEGDKLVADGNAARDLRVPAMDAQPGRQFNDEACRLAPVCVNILSGDIRNIALEPVLLAIEDDAGFFPMPCAAVFLGAEKEAEEAALPEREWSPL